MAIEAAVAEILPTLEAYAQRFGVPQREAELDAVIGAVISIREDLAAWVDQADGVIERVRAVFDPEALAHRELGTLAHRLFDEAQQRLAERIHDWRRQQQETVLGILNAYVQTFPEAFERTQLPSLVATLMPMMADWRLTKPEVRSLLGQVIQKFDIAKALRQVVDPEWIAIARRLAHYRRHAALETTVIQVVQAYQQGFNPAVLTQTLVEQVLAKVLDEKWNLDLTVDTAWAESDTKLMIKQVMFKVQLLEASPRVEKSAEAIAAQVNAEIERFKREEAGNPAVDATQPTRLGDLEMGIDIHEA